MEFGASIFPSDAGTDLIAAVSTVVTDNLPIVLAVFGFFLGLRLAFRFFGKATRGKIGV